MDDHEEKGLIKSKILVDTVWNFINQNAVWDAKPKGEVT